MNHTSVTPLTLQSLAVPVKRSMFGSSSREVVLDNTDCSGSEASLLECASLNSQMNEAVQCFNSEVAGVVCGGEL